MKKIENLNFCESGEMPAYQIRRLEIDDYDKGFLETLENLSEVGQLSREEFSSIFKEISENPMCHIFVAEINEKVVGTAKLLIERKFIHKGSNVAHIEDVAVQENLQGNGIGAKLVLLACLEARLNRCYKVILNCAEHNVPFYERCGFRRNEIEMRMDLK